MLESKFDAQEVIDAGHPPVARKVVCVDYDGTIFPFGNMMGDGPPMTGAVDAIKALKSQGYTIAIFSSRFSKAWHEHEGWDHRKAYAEQEQYCTDMLGMYGIPFDFFTSEKIPAEAYFDDKAYRVSGDTGLLDAVNEFLGEQVGF